VFFFSPLTGNLPNWRLPLLISLNLAGMGLTGSIPQDWWTNMPALSFLDLSLSKLTGSIPPPPVQRYFTIFAVPGNSLSGPLPINISASYYDVSANQLQGDVTTLADSQAMPATPISRLKLSGNRRLTCPILLGGLTALAQLELQAGGFNGCDFTNTSQVVLPSSLTYLDVSGSRRTDTHVRTQKCVQCVCTCSSCVAQSSCIGLPLCFLFF